jgi:two-component sensor histidine kinase
MYNNEEKSHKYGILLDKIGNKKFFDFITSEEKIYSEVKSPFTQIEEFAKGFFLSLGTTSAIFAGIRHRGDIAGFICFESKTPGGKEWTPEQRDFVVSTSNIVTIALESDERQKAEEETLKSLKDKELLLKEIHHRVKNNLAVVSSLLYLQSQKTQNKQILDALLESQLRLKSMVLVHEKLYRSKDLSSINYSEYIETLAATLFRSYEYESKRINLELDVKDIYLDTDTATNLGLIINELISNSIKHAFPEERSGKIAISFHLDKDGLYTLIVKDDGVSMPPGFDFQETETLGLKLVSTLTEQIEGTLSLEKNEGTCFKIQFRKQS